MPNSPIVGKQDFQDSNHKLVFSIDPDSSFVQIIMKSFDLQVMEITNTGSLTLRDSARMDGLLGMIMLGGGDKSGKIALMNGKKENVIFLDGAGGDVVVGGSGQDGDIVLQDKTGKVKMRLVGSHGHAWLGGSGTSGLLTLFPEGVENVTDTAKATIFLDGHNGDVVLQNADCAEDFDLADAESPEPGAIMVIDDQGKLRQSHKAYDRTVVGVLSGAGECRPGIILDRRPSDNPRAALAMVGKVYCKVDATYNPINVGDLLTTSATPGHAMKAADPQQAFGAVIGKALRAHREGPGLIPILAALQ